MAINPAAAFSTGDLMRRVAELERRLDALSTARRLEASTIGSGGLRVTGAGGITLQQGGSLRVEDGGDIEVVGGELTALDPAEDLVFQVTTDPASIFMRKELISALATEILADRIFSDEVATLEPTSSATYTDLATVGPEVELEISNLGLALVWYGGTISPSAVGVGGSISFAVSGATTIAATNWSAVLIQEGTTGPQLGASKVAKVDLNPGTNKFTLKYQRLGAANNVNFFDRTIVVIGF